MSVVNRSLKLVPGPGSTGAAATTRPSTPALLVRAGWLSLSPTVLWPGASATSWLAAARGSADHVDAAVIAVCAAAGGGVVLTADPKDLSALSGGSPAITVHRLGRR